MRELIFSVQSALTDDPDEEIYYENMPERATEELMQLQKYVCKTLDVKPEDFSSIGSDDVFIYSVEPFPLISIILSINS